MKTCSTPGFAASRSLRRRVLLALVIGAALAGCDKYAKPDAAYPPRDVFDISLDCADRRTGDLTGALSVAGNPGEGARLEVLCGARVCGGCDALVDATGRGSCTIDPSEPCADGRASCRVVAISGVVLPADPPQDSCPLEN
jgi:hypothetical protein